MKYFYCLFAISSFILS